MSAIATDSFLIAFGSFVDRHGVPDKITCDQGSQINYENWDLQTLADSVTARHKLDWVFSLVTSAWFNGQDVQLVGLAKVQLLRLIANKRLFTRELAAVSD